MVKKVVLSDPIKNYVRKNLMKVSDEGIMVIPNSQKVDFQSAILKELLIKNGIDPSAIKTENAMNEAMAFINQRAKQETGIMAASQGNVIDIRDKMPNPFENLDKAVKEGNFMGIKSQVLKDPDIKKDFEAMKKFPTRTAEGEEAIPIAMKAKFDEEVPYKPLSDEDYTVGKLVSDFKQYGKATDEDIQMILGSGKAGQIPYVMSERGMSYKDVISTLKSGKPLIEGLAQGGRIGYKDGPEKPSRRKFLKIAGGLAALPIIGKFFKPAKVGTVAKTAPKIVTTAPETPSYFFDLVNKIKILGDEGKSISPRTKTTTYKNYELQEDLTTGDIVIVKQKGDPDFAYEEEVLSLRKGQADETTKGKTPPDEYEEFTVRPDGDGKMKDVEDGIEPEGIKEIMEELDTGGGNIDELTLQEIKKGKLASGGIARMLGE